MLFRSMSRRRKPTNGYIRSSGFWARNMIMLQCRLKSADSSRQLHWNFNASAGKVQQGIEVFYLPSHTSQPTTFTLNTHYPPREQVLACYSNFPTLFCFLLRVSQRCPATPVDLSLHLSTRAVNSALAARRYADSHLLALRFGNCDSLDDSERGCESYGMMCVRSWRS